MVYSVQRESHLQSCVSVWQRDIQSSTILRTLYGMDEKNQTLYIHDSWRFETRLIEDSFRISLSLFFYWSKLMLDNIINIIVKACKMFRWCEQIDWRMQHRFLHHGLLHFWFLPEEVSFSFWCCDLRVPPPLVSVLRSNPQSPLCPAC